MRNLADDANKPLVTCVTGITPLSVEGGKDPHAWFTPRNAAIYVRNILKAVSELDPEHASEYRARTELYLRQLETLDAWVKKQVASIPEQKRILVTSHDAFGYFCAAYKFKSAAPTGWSTGAEVGAGPTPARRKAAIDSIRTMGVKAVFVETSVNKDLIFEIAKEAGVVVGGELYSDSMGTAGSAGETYIGMMRENVLKITRGLLGE
jgi:manganese/iron transport system substrate-binding protein